MKRITCAAAAFAAAALLFILCACSAASSNAQLSPQESAIIRLAVFFENRWNDSSVSLNGNDEWAVIDLCIAGRTPSRAIVQRFETKYSDPDFTANASTSDLVRAVLVLCAVSPQYDQLAAIARELNRHALEESSIYTIPYVLAALKCMGPLYEETCLLLKDRILAMELKEGGWSGFGSHADADTSGPAMMALSYYIASDAAAADACARASESLVSLYGKEGVVPSNGSSACSTGMLVLGLAAVGADYALPLQGLLSLLDDHTLFSVRSGDIMSNEQGLRALVASLHPGTSIYALISSAGEG